MLLSNYNKEFYLFRSRMFKAIEQNSIRAKNNKENVSFKHNNPFNKVKDKDFYYDLIKAVYYMGDSETDLLIQSFGLDGSQPKSMEELSGQNKGSVEKILKDIESAFLQLDISFKID